VQSSDIADRSGSAFAQAPRPLCCAFANVLTAFAHVLAGAGPSFLVLITRAGLRLGGSLILTRIRGARDDGQAQKNKDARRPKNRAELEVSFHFLSPAGQFKMTITSYAGLMLLGQRQVAGQDCFSSRAILLNSKRLLPRLPSSLPSEGSQDKPAQGWEGGVR
jgi:hypothetical protein